MDKITSTLAGLIACGWLVGTPSIGQETLPNEMSRVTTVAELSDVGVNDWAFQALQGLAERYGCIAGLPNSTFQGYRSLTRYEFSAGLDSCIRKLSEVMQVGLADKVTKEDLEVLQRLQTEFATELSALKEKTKGLETSVDQLEASQFSPIAKLNGEAIFGFAFASGGENNLTNPNPQRNAVFANLLRLGVQATFTGDDRLRIFLTSGNFNNGGFSNPSSLNTLMSRLSYQAGLENQVILDLLEYRTPITDRLVVTVVPVGFSLTNILGANSPYFDTGRGSISSFAEASPILKIGGVLDAGIGFDWLISDNVRLQFAYGAGNSRSTQNTALPNFTGADRNVFGTNILIKPAENTILGLQYINAYSNDGSLGTFTGSINAETGGLWSRANLPTSNRSLNSAPDNNPCCNNPIGNQPAKIDAIGGTFQWKIGDVVLGAWGGLAYTNFLNTLPGDIDAVASTEGILPGQPGETLPPGVPAGVRNPTNAANNRKPYGAVSTYLFSLGLTDPFGREGDLFAILVGQPPKLFEASPTSLGQPVPFFEVPRRGENIQQIDDNNPSLIRGGNLSRVGTPDQATSYHVEMFYRFRVNQYLTITPGFFVVTNPGHNPNNNTLMVGTIRTTFRF